MTSPPLLNIEVGRTGGGITVTLTLLGVDARVGTMDLTTAKIIRAKLDEAIKDLEQDNRVAQSIILGADEWNRG